MENTKEFINKRVKNQLEDRIVNIVNSFKNMECVECITFSSFYNPENGQTVAGVTMICDNEENACKLENNYQILEYVDDIKICLGFTYRDELLEYRDKYFKVAEHILVDKKDYKILQDNMINYKTSFDNLVDFVPPLSFNKKNTR